MLCSLQRGRGEIFTRISEVPDRRQQMQDWHIFEHISRSSRVPAVESSFFVIVHAQNQDTGVAVFARHVARRIHGARSREAEVQQHHIWLQKLREMSSFATISRFANNFKVRFPSQDDLHALSVDSMIVTDQY